MSVTPFEVETGEAGTGIRVLTVKGELDLETTPSLERALETAGVEEAEAILFDLSACEFIDSTGLALLVRTWRQVCDGDESSGERRVALCCPNVQVKRVIEITGLSDTIPIYSDRSEALDALRAATS